ncbi:MAG: hypothetical protein LBS73_00985, partial [Campylobacteraceae bacterium]|jgi:hypothetical protein|nr:hypothetical protein [Campylobacteraceae bacterium]
MNRETDIRNIRNTESEKSTKEMKKEAKVSTKLLTSTAMTGEERNTDCHVASLLTMTQWACVAQKKAKRVDCHAAVTGSQ